MNKIISFKMVRKATAVVAATAVISGVTLVGAAGAVVVDPVAQCSINPSATTVGPGETIAVSIDVEPSPGQVREVWSADLTPVTSQLITQSDTMGEIPYEFFASFGATSKVSLSYEAVDSVGNSLGASLCAVDFYLDVAIVGWETPVALPDATVGVPYNQDFVAGGRYLPYCIEYPGSVNDVPGLTLENLVPVQDVSDPEFMTRPCYNLAGIPTTPGDYTIKLVANVGGRFAIRTFTLKVVAPTPPAPEPTPAPDEPEVPETVVPVAHPRFTG